MKNLILKILLALKMAAKDKELQEIYNRIFGDAMKYSHKFPLQMVAATYIAIAMRLYKTTLSDEDYKHMIESVVESEIEPFVHDKETLH